MDTRPIIIATICIFMLNNSTSCWMQKKPDIGSDTTKVNPQDLQGTFLEEFKIYLIPLSKTSIPIPEWKGPIQSPHDQEAARKTLENVLLGCVWSLCESYEKYQQIEKKLLALKLKYNQDHSTINKDLATEFNGNGHTLPVTEEELIKAQVIQHAFSIIATNVSALQLQARAGLVKVSQQVQAIKTELARYEQCQRMSSYD